MVAKGRERVWSRFPGCGKDLEERRALAEEKRIKPRVAQTFPLTSRGARDAFAALHSRRTVGKVVVLP